MPIVPEDIAQLNFDERDLFLDVRLTTVSITDPPQRDEQGFSILKDYTGRPTFKTGFFRDGIGFGITSVKITTNASLQPTIDIEFKDLYGKTVFADLNEDRDNGVNYGAIFQWPPPKFEFTFKGYLGKPVTWILNLKSTSTNYNSDDGSYSIKATFIPNQWGMFADIPFLYLYAVKKLRMDALGLPTGDEEKNNAIEFKNSEKNPNATKEADKVQSIFDIMYIGKTLEATKSERTKEYDEIVTQLSILKSDPIGGLIAGNIKIPRSDDPFEISSRVVGRAELPTPGSPDAGDLGFTKILCVLPDDTAYSDERSEDEILTYLKAIPPSLRNVENMRIKIATYNKTTNGNLSSIDPSTMPSGQELGDLKKNSNKLDGIIDKNLDSIDEAIKGILFQNNEESLKKLTISEVFTQIAKDTAFIMGYILDAGEQGYWKSKPTNGANQREVQEKEGNIIGLYFPMTFKTDNTNADNNGEMAKQVPATMENLGGGVDLQVENYEMKFVSDFITAVSFGIAQNRALTAQAATGADNKIKHRVNNIELIANNPFLNKRDWREIGGIIMKRAGIVGYLTQSNDPNKPGDYPSGGGRDNSPDDMRKMADGDVVNIDDNVLLQLDTENFEGMKRFCDFWLTLIEDEDGLFIGPNNGKWKYFNWRGGNAPESDIPGAGRYDGSVNRMSVLLNPGVVELAISQEAKEIVAGLNLGDKQRVITGNSNKSFQDRAGALYDNTRNVFDYSSPLGAQLKDAGVDVVTVEQFLENMIGYVFFGRTTRQAIDGKKRVPPSLTNSVNFYDTLTPLIYINGLTYIHAGGRGASDDYEHLVFTDPEDTQALDEFTPSNPTDGEVQNEEKDEDEPLGIVDVDRVLETDDDGDVSALERALYLVERRDKGLCLWYNYCKRHTFLPGTYDGFKVYSNKTDVAGTKIYAYTRDEVNKFNMDFKASFSEEDTSPQEDPNQAHINVRNRKIVYVAYAQTWDRGDMATPAGLGLWGQSDCAIACRVFLRQFCKQLKSKLIRLEDEQNKLFGSVLGKAGEHEDLLYQQMHNLFHQWHILAHLDGKRIIDNTFVEQSSAVIPQIAYKLEEVYGKTSKDIDPLDVADKDDVNDGSEFQGGFRYDYPLQAISKDKEGNDRFLKVENSIINIDPLFNAKANTTVLNIFQQICTKNNFLFFPIPGNSDYNNISEIFQPVTTVKNPKIGNFFQVLFQPTPESRSILSDSTPITTHGNPEDFAVDAFPVRFGDPKNKIIKNVTVGTDDNKVTAESIVNLQRIVDNENKNRTVTTDCSLLSVFEGRSYKAKVETFGNAQLSPMQFFYLQNHTIFTGLYQIIKVEHSIEPNDMTTEFEGIKMRYLGNSGYGGVHPVTLDDFQDAASFVKEATNEIGETTGEETIEDFEASDSGGFDTIESSAISDVEVESVDVGAGSRVSTTKIQIPPSVKEFFTRTNNFANGLPEVQNSLSNGDVYTREEVIRYMNEMLVDRWAPFAEFLNKNYPELKGKIKISSGPRNGVPHGGSSTSQHLRGQAVDFGFESTRNKLNNTFNLLNYLLQFHRVNNLSYDQILFETTHAGSIWIHWSYTRNNSSGIFNNRLRFYDHSTVKGAPMNNSRNSSISQATTELTASEARANKLNGRA